MKWVFTGLHALDYYAGLLARRLGNAWFALLFTLALVALVLGYLGSHRLEEARHLPHSPLDDLYQALQLFAVQTSSDLDSIDLPPTFDIARFLAAFVSFSAAVGVVGKVFGDQIQASRLWLLGRGHVVLCGLGGAGDHLVERLRRTRRFVVIIESDPNHVGLPRCRELGAVILTGSPAEATRLRKARVTRADTVLAVLRGDDRLNVETAAVTYELCREAHPGRLTFVLQVSRPELLAVVLKHPMADESDDRFDLQFFDAREACARGMLREARLIGPGDGPDHLLVVGLGRADRLGEALILRAAKDRYVDKRPNAPVLIVDVVAPDATARVEDILSRHRFLAGGCEVRPQGIPLHTHSSTNLDERQHAKAAFVCIGDESKALIEADRLRSMLPEEVPIVVRTIEREAGLGALIRCRASPPLIAVGLKDCVLDLASSLHPVEELLAQSIHQEYLDHLRKEGSGPAVVTASSRHWNDLPEEYRDDNRAQARDIRHKLELVHCRLAYTPEDLIDTYQFSDAEVELLAREEHDRWCAEKRRRGYRHGPERDEKRQLHPDMTGWENLSEAGREKARNTVRRLPTVLAKADYRIRRS